MSAERRNVLEKLAKTIRKMNAEPSSSRYGALTEAASSYSIRPTRSGTIPTGFDPHAAGMFEALVEAAFLVATADGLFDTFEREAFEVVVGCASKNFVKPKDMNQLMSHLEEQLAKEGLDRRIHEIVRVVQRHEYQIEVVRIAALMAAVSDDIGDAEQEVLNALVRGFQIPEDKVQSILDEANQIMDAPQD